MKVYIVGHKGWIGQMYIELFTNLNIEYCFSEYRGESHELLCDILNQSPTNILCCMGRTHGTHDGMVYNTIDYLENDGTLVENINDNLYVPLNLALFAKEHSIHFTYIGTGCIFSYDVSKMYPPESVDSRRIGYPRESGESGESGDSRRIEYPYELRTGLIKGFNEDESANFFGSNYSIVKGFTDMLMRHTDALVLRIRMPITSTNHPRNFITKILQYKKICSMPNSMSVLDELIPLSIKMMYANDIGCFNFTNPGYIDHNSILLLYRNYIDKDFTWENMSVEEQNSVLKAGRSNNVLCTDKLEKKYQVDTIEEAMEKVFKNWKN